MKILKIISIWFVLVLGLFVLFVYLVVFMKLNKEVVFEYKGELFSGNYNMDIIYLDLFLGFFVGFWVVMLK